MASARYIEHRTALTVGLLSGPMLTGCELVKGIFKAGLWTGVIGVVLVLALIAWGVSKVARH